MNDEFDDSGGDSDLDDGAAFFKRAPASRHHCPRCGIGLVPHPSGEKVLLATELMPGRGQAWGVRAGPFDTSTDEGRRDAKTFRPGVHRCMDFAACEARAGAVQRAEWWVENRPADPESEFVNPRLRWVDVGEKDHD